MVRQIMTPEYEAFDGTVHKTHALATAHEEENFSALLVGLTIEQVKDAIARKPHALPLAAAMEKAGTHIARTRRDAGELKRRPAEKPPAAGGQTEPPQSSSPAEPDAGQGVDAGGEDETNSGPLQSEAA